MMRSMDIDGDGKLARTELRGRSAERFDELDADGDGYITKAELENSPEPLMRSGGDPR